jgi:AraC-like DNA-binding protein
VLAQQAGFSDFRLMALEFSKKLGLTPTAYRHQVRQPAGTVGP